MIVLHCKECHNTFSEYQMDVSAHCPFCRMPIFSDSELTEEFDSSDVDPKQLWAIFGSIPIDLDDCIEDDFLGFEKRTYRFDIWHWFEDTFKMSIGSGDFDYDYD